MQSFNIPAPLLKGLQERAEREGTDIESLINNALAEQVVVYGIISYYDSGEIWKEEIYSLQELKERRTFYGRLLIQNKPLKGNRRITGFKVMRYGAKRIEVLEYKGEYRSPYSSDIPLIREAGK